MKRGPDRRAFLRRLGVSTFGAPLAGWACTTDQGNASAGRDAGAAARPVLLPWADDIVHMVAPPRELPVCYVSMALRQVYVDHEHRDRAAWLLKAHISVSTLLWRIPLPGDPEGQPVVPGDERREFEELPMRAWDPGQRPAIDDVRIVRGEPVRRRIDFACVPLVGDGPLLPLGEAAARPGRWLSVAPPFEVTVGAGPGRAARAAADALPADTTAFETGTVREDFRIVGSALRHEDRDCAGPGDVVQLVSWAAR